MDLHLDILPRPQRELWEKLSAIPEGFVLYGDTAIALQLGHRQSIDFDFFARTSFDPQHLLESNPLLAGSEVVALSANTLTVRVGDTEPVLMSFFGVPRLPVLRPPHRIGAPRTEVGHLLELAGMKAMVVQKRAEAKDYVDLHALIFQAHIDLSSALAAGAFLYPPHFAPELTLKSLCYFDDGNLANVPVNIRQDLARAVRAVDVQALPVLKASPQ
jgi:hypothetical protein